MKKEIIISAAVDGREKYSEIVHGLEKSIIDAGWEGDVEIYRSFPDWIIPHKVIPYSFKYQLILKKLNDGYSKVYWLDSTMRLVTDKNLSDIWKETHYAMVVFDNIGHKLINYINDTAIKNICLEAYDITFRDPLESIKQIWGGAIFFDFNYDYAVEFLNHILNQMLVGSFNEDGTNRLNFIQHRHDQATISGLCHLYDVPILPYGYIAAPKDVTDKTFIIYGDR
jgi:hypothetical protein